MDGGWEQVLLSAVMTAMALCAGSAWGQTAPASGGEAKRAEFEVVSIKPADPKGSGIVNGLSTYPGGRIVCSQCTLQYLVMEAFDVQPWQVTGGPDWMAKTHFFVEAKPAEGSAASKLNAASRKTPPSAEQREMLQTMLAGRFHLKVHRAQRTGQVYLLVKSGRPLKLDPPKDTQAFSWAGSATAGAPFAHGVAGTNISMAQLAARLSGALGRPVLDQTGIAGAYDFRYEYPADDPNTNDVSTVLDSIQGIGLKLVQAKGPVETVVVDGAEMPSAN